VNFCQSYIQPSNLTLTTCVVGAFIRVFKDKMRIFEVEFVLFQIGLSFCLIPNKHQLIVDTIKSRRKVNLSQLKIMRHLSAMCPKYNPL